MVFTSYFENLYIIQKDESLEPLAITKDFPEWIEKRGLKQPKQFHPFVFGSGNSITEKINTAFSALQMLKPDEVIELLKKQASGKIPVLLDVQFPSRKVEFEILTQESRLHLLHNLNRWPELFSNRYFVSRWLNKHGIRCLEMRADYKEFLK